MNITEMRRNIAAKITQLQAELERYRKAFDALAAVDDSPLPQRDLSRSSTHWRGVAEAIRTTIGSRSMTVSQLARELPRFTKQQIRQSCGWLRANGVMSSRHVGGQKEHVFTLIRREEAAE